jgi:uncharacterized protein (TIGR02231 family)
MDKSQMMTNAYSPSSPPKPLDAEEATASVIEEASGLAATFLLEGRKDVPSDGEPHRFKVQIKEIEPEMVLFTTPRLDATAFLVARFSAPGGLPLFPNSPVVRFAGNQRLGEAPLAVPPAGQPFSLGYGPFKSVRAAFRHVDAKLEQVGTFTKDRQWTLRERIEISNDSTEDLNVEVQDRILKSTSDQVKITLLPDFTTGWIETLPGVRTWKLKLPAKGQTAIQMPVAIRTPREGVITGLEELDLPME